jgi:hypothetical protein
MFTSFLYLNPSIVDIFFPLYYEHSYFWFIIYALLITYASTIAFYELKLSELLTW